MRRRVTLQLPVKEEETRLTRQLNHVVHSFTRHHTPTLREEKLFSILIQGQNSFESLYLASFDLEGENDDEISDLSSSDESEVECLK